MGRYKAHSGHRAPKMGHPGISSVPLPSPRFDLTNIDGFESERAAASEDRYRAARLRMRAETAKPRRGRALRELADAIDPEVTPNPATPASSRYMRDQRNRVIGAVWESIDDAQHRRGSQAPYATCHLVPEDWGVQLGELHAFNPPERMATIRTHIYRSAAKIGVAVEGQLIAFLHGAYDPATQRYPLHIHGIAVGAMVEIVDGLRDLRKYRAAQPGDGRDAANTPVRLSRGPLTNMPEPLTYQMKGFWPLRETYIDGDGLRKAFDRKAVRIREEAELEYLRFLDRWRLEDVTLIMGMYASSEGLVLTK